MCSPLITELGHFSPDSKVHVANMGSPGTFRVGPTNLATCVCTSPYHQMELPAEKIFINKFAETLEGHQTNKFGKSNFITLWNNPLIQDMQFNTQACMMMYVNMRQGTIPSILMKLGAKPLPKPQWP